MSKTRLIDIISKKNSFGPSKNYYVSGGQNYEFGTLAMYRKFNENFADKNNMNRFFSSEDGIEILLKILCDPKFKLIRESKENTEYEREVSIFLSKIRSFFIHISADNSLTDIWNTYNSRNGDFKDKSLKENSNLYPTIVDEFEQIIQSLHKSSNRQITNISTTSGDFNIKDITKKQIFSSLKYRDDTEHYLSPVNSSVFEDIRTYAKDFLGEGKTISSDNDGMNINKNANDATLCLEFLLQYNLYERRNIGYANYNNLNDSDDDSDSDSDSDDDSEKKKNKKHKKKPKRKMPKITAENINFNHNDTASTVNFLKFILEYPFFMFIFLKAYEHILLITPENERISDIEQLKSIFGYVHTTFEFPKDSTTYFGGTNTRQSSVIKFIDRIKGDLSAAGQITPIPIRGIKSVMQVLNTIKNNPKLQKSQLDSALEITTKIITDKLGEIVSTVGGSEGPDAWQEDFMEAVDAGKSIILVGDTSGGKTAISLFEMRKLFKNIRNKKGICIIYVGPTDILVNLQYSNMLKQFFENKQFIGVCSESIVDIPSECKLLIGTPKEIRNYLYRCKITSQVTEENVSYKFAEEFRNPELKLVKKVFIDEIQTMSTTYAQENSIEQHENCKAIEDIMFNVKYSEDNISQLICMSATLSDTSIQNLKDRIGVITDITDIEVIKYGFDDIGYKRRMNRSKFKPIMKRQIKYPIKYDNGHIRKYEDNETVVQGEVNSELIERLFRKAKREHTVPFGVFCGDELDTISTYEMFISYLKIKASNCLSYNSIKREYDRAKIERKNGFTNVVENKTYWKGIIMTEINRLSNIGSSDIVELEDFEILLNEFNRISGSNFSNRNMVLSPDIYGLMYEYIKIDKDQPGFISDINPYFKFGREVSSINFFNLENSDGSDTVLKKILDAQNANPSENTGNFIPLFLEGIKFGICILTKTTPFGFQAEILKFLNIKTKELGDKSPLPFIFCDYSVSAGINVAFLAGVILLKRLTVLNPSIFKQINGRFGRRGVDNSITPVTYVFNVSNISELSVIEDLNFQNPQSCNTFTADDIYDFLLKIMIKYENNKEYIRDRNLSYIDNIISGDCFKNISEMNYPLKVRRIHLAKCQIKELYDRLRYMIPTICDNILNDFYMYLQSAEFYELNAQATLR